jgi:hypothetical protein
MSTPRGPYCESHARPAGVREGSDLTKQIGQADPLWGLVPHPIVDEDWCQVIGQVPADLETSARESLALRRRRQVQRAEDLLRMALAYALCDWSLRIVAAWACAKGWADLSDTALMRRLRGARVWLGALVAALVITNRAELAGRPVRVRLADASVVGGPGSKGTDWRLHLSLDLGQGCIDGLEVTDSRGGETLVRHPAGPGDIQVVDRGYSHRRGIGRALARGGKLVVRIAVGNVPLADETGRALDILDWLRRRASRLPTGRFRCAWSPNA